MTAIREMTIGADLSEQQAREIFAQGEEAVVFALLELAKRVAEQQAAMAASSHQTPATPSGMKPPYAKPTASRRGKKTPGQKPGHPGTRRKTPERIDWHTEQRADRCPDCGGRLNRCEETRTRYTEDIPDIQPEVTEHTIHRDWCPQCRKKVEPPVPDALPSATLGNRVLVLSAWLHFARPAWRTCCENWSIRKNTNRRTSIGQPSPRSCAGCWAMRFGCGDNRKSFRRIHTPPAASD